MSRKKERQAEVKRIREEGSRAFHNGKHVQTNPYKRTSMNRFHWADGYFTASEEQERYPQHD